MHYVVGDVHNDNGRLHRMLNHISFMKDGEDADHLYLLGDLFDRGGIASYLPRRILRCGQTLHLA